MARKAIPIDVERKLCAESMGRCMNPDCQAELFRKKGNVIEKAHITPYCKTADNDYENLVILCPTCHTDFDKNDAFDPEQVKQWKLIRRERLRRFSVRSMQLSRNYKGKYFRFFVRISTFMKITILETKRNFGTILKEGF